MITNNQKAKLVALDRVINIQLILGSNQYDKETPSDRYCEVVQYTCSKTDKSVI